MKLDYILIQALGGLKECENESRSRSGRNKTMSLGGHLEEYQLEKQPAEQRQEIGSPLKTTDF
jgi:hypothetical protein